VARPIGLSKADDTEVWDTQLPVVEHTPKTTDAIASFDLANEKYIVRRLSYKPHQPLLLVLILLSKKLVSEKSPSFGEIYTI
jgi:hypothetical protein